ncbi:MAG: hypothetical protein P8074_25580 [Anaerolineales bacterium]
MLSQIHELFLDFLAIFDRQDALGLGLILGLAFEILFAGLDHVLFIIFAYHLGSFVKSGELLMDNVDINLHYEWWLEVYAMWTTDLNELGFRDVDIAFSGFSSQGDGASFTAKDIDIARFIKKEKISARYRPLLNALEHDWWISGEVRRDKYHRYVHENTTSVYLETDHDSEMIWEFVDELQQYIQRRLPAINRQIYRDLEKACDRLTAKDAIAETLRQVLFLSDGTVFQPGWERGVREKVR